MILAKAMGLLTNTPYLKGDSLLAYLLGTTLGLFILKAFGKDKLLNRFTKYSLLSGATSGVLLILIFFYQDSIIGGSYWSFLFFLTLILRFGFWFLARIARVDIAAGVNSNLAWTESSYCLGVILGLLIWPSWLTIIQLLCIDILAQLISAFLDNYSFKLLKDFLKNSHIEKVGKIPSHIFIGFAGFVVCLTIATQIIEFGFATFSVEFFQNGKIFAANLVAAGYIGAALAGWFLGKVNLTYHEADKFLGAGSIVSKKYKFPVIYGCLASFGLLVAAFMIAFSSWRFSKEISLVMFTLSTLIYECVVLVLLDKLGQIAKKIGDVGSVATVYAYLGSIGSLFMFIFVHTLTGTYTFIFASIIFFIFGYLFLFFLHKKQIDM